MEPLLQSTHTLTQNHPFDTHTYNDCIPFDLMVHGSVPRERQQQQKQTQKERFPDWSGCVTKT